MAQDGVFPNIFKTLFLSSLGIGVTQEAFNAASIRCCVWLLLFTKELQRYLSVISLPFAMFQPSQCWQRCYLLQVVCQIKQLFVRIPIPVCVLIWANDKAILRVHDIVAPQVIHHDCIRLIVLTRELGPDEAQWLAVK